MKKAAMFRIALLVLPALLAAAPAAWAQGAVKPGGPVGGGGSSASSGHSLIAGNVGVPGGRATSSGFAILGGVTAALPVGPAFTLAPVSPPAAGAAATVTAEVTSGAGAAMTLYYRLGGDGVGEYNAVAMTTSDGVSFQGVIPGAQVGVRGLEYYVAATQGGATTTQPAANPQTAPFRLRVTLANQRGPALPDASYRLFGFPFDVSPDGVGAVFTDDLGDTNRSQWRLGRWNHALAAYQNYHEVGPIKRGRGYWLIARGGRSVGASGQSAIPDTTIGGQLYARLVLLPGWNMIANPHAFPVAWNLRVADPAGGIESVLWAWNGSGYESVVFLEAYTGYWVNNTAAAARLLMLPYVDAQTLKLAEADGAGGAVKTPAEGWRLRLEVTAGDLSDRSTEIGALPEADDGADALDYGKPPCPPGRYVSLVSLADAGGAAPRRLAGDFRAPSLTGWRFPLLLQGTEDEPVTLRLAGAERLPPDCQVALVDPAGGAVYSLPADGELVLPRLPTPEGVRFDLVVGPEAWLRDEVGEPGSMPVRPALLGNYPNPFNPSTNIAFELPAPGRARLEVLDLAGRRVATVLDETRPGGRQTAVWDGRDDRGRAAASGAYLYRLTAGDFRQTRSMLLLK